MCPNCFAQADEFWRRHEQMQMAMLIVVTVLMVVFFFVALAIEIGR
jgi:hypothetical protein